MDFAISHAAGRQAALLLTCAEKDEPFAGSLREKLRDAGFRESLSPAAATCVVAVVSGRPNARLAEDLESARAADCPVLVIALDDLELPPCLTAYRVPLKSADAAGSAFTWLGGILDRTPVAWDGESAIAVPSAFWTRAFAIAAEDLKRAARSGAADHALATGTLFAVLARGADGQLTVAPGWKNDLPAQPPGSILVSLEGPFAGLESTDDDFFERAKTKPEDYADRAGYDPDFLGVRVPLPRTRQRVEVLKYTNFSVAQNLDRRLSMYTAVNIDGAKLIPLTREGDPWIFDPRIPQVRQVGPKYYTGTPLDRGHMVRRIDPVWGPKHVQAELDTFHYPNSCPQHRDLNRKVWNDLEDFILTNLDRDNMKVTVFTGPVLAGDDRLFRQVPLPREFWKVVVIRLKGRTLSATAYLLSQEDMVKGLEFVFGEFRTFQVTVDLIEKKTGLDFGNLRQFDPKRKRAAGLESEMLPAEIRGPADLILGDASAPAPEWDDPISAEKRLREALDTFDWPGSAVLVDELVRTLARNPSKIDERLGRRVLAALQRKRRFTEMTRVADAFLQAGLGTHQVQRRYAQALIEQKLFHAAESVLREMIADPNAPAVEREEAQGLLGRIAKQVYVDAGAPANARNAAALQRAVDAYRIPYAARPSANYWHGINLVACLRMAESDSVRIEAGGDALRIAEDIRRSILSREDDAVSGELQAWELATSIEVHLALGDHAEAIRRTALYVACRDADAFEIASTLRQFKQVWRLRDDAAPGDEILPLLRSALLQREGGELRLSPESAKFELEKVFGSDRAVTLAWYRAGLDRAQSIARIETNDRGFGTGWLIEARQLFDGATGSLLITNAHVIGPDTPDRHPDALRPEHAMVHFQMQGLKMPAGRVVYHSPVNRLDATVLELPGGGPPGAQPLPLDPVKLLVEAPPQRLYIVGHPSGRDLEFSLQDNHLLAATERVVHYRTPTEGGSSGSPVFGPKDWKVVALHHAGKKDMPRLDGQPGSYEANEGIALLALLQEIRR